MNSDKLFENIQKENKKEWKGMKKVYASYGIATKMKIFELQEFKKRGKESGRKLI